MIRRIAASLALLGAGLALAGCAQPVTVESEDVIEFTVTLDDGRSLDCLSLNDEGSEPEGLDCDWEAAK